MRVTSTDPSDPQPELVVSNAGPVRIELEPPPAYVNAPEPRNRAERRALKHKKREQSCRSCRSFRALP